jgi:hypothetical protein
MVGNETLGQVSVFSLTGSIIADFVKVKKEDQEFKKIIKKLTGRKYKPKIIENLQKKYMDKPEVYEKKVNELADKFIDDYSKFREKYSVIFDAIIKTIEAAEKEEYQEIIGIKEVIREIGKVATNKPGRLYFPKGSREKFEKEFTDIFELLKKQLTEEYVVFQGTFEGKKNAFGFFSKFVSRRSAERKGLRAATKLDAQAKKLKSVSQRIKQELKGDANVKLILLLLQHAIEIEKTEKELKIAKMDILAILQDVMVEVAEVVHKIAEFIVAIETSKKIETKMEIARKIFMKNQARIQESLKQEKRWPIILNAAVIDLKRNQKSLLTILTGINEKRIQKVVDDVVHRELGGAAYKRTAA